MGMVDFKTGDRTHMYVTIHDTAKFCSLTYIIPPTTNNTVSSTLQLFGKMWPS